MRPTSSTCLALAGVLTILSAAGCSLNPRPDRPGSTEPASTDGWVGLFDGRTLEGWLQRGGAADYRVQDGCIVGATRPNQPNSFLCTRDTYRDFELELEFLVDPALNSGVQVRSESRLEGKIDRVFGYQVEIDPSDRAWTAGIYDEGRRGWLGTLRSNPAAQRAFRQGQWNALRIVCRGDLIATWLNGQPAAEIHDAMTPEGFIALQVHGVGSRKDELTVRWRNIRLKK